MPGHDAWLAKALSDLKLANSRYPDDRFSIDRLEVEEAIIRASKIFDFIKKKMTTKTNPTLKIFD